MNASALSILAYIKPDRPFAMFLLITSYCFAQGINHRLYFLEHKKRNTTLGRLIHDIVYILTSFVIYSIILKLTDHFYIIGHYSNLIILLTLVVLCIEFILTIINFFFRKFNIELW